MRDYVYVNEGNEQDFVDRALKLGYDDLVFVYEKKPKQAFSHEKIKIITLIKNSKSKEGYFLLGTSLSKIPKGVTQLVSNEFDVEKDFVHQRRSGLNHVQMQVCKDQHITVLFSFAPLQLSNLITQSTILGRMKQNVLLCKKYGVHFELVSCAQQPDEMRHARDVQALSRSLFS